MNTINVNTINLSDKIIKKSTSTNNQNSDIFNYNDFSKIGDGKTHFIIELIDEHSLDIYLYIKQTIPNGVEINWGDGSDIEKFESTGYTTLTHVYNKIGKYDISLNPINDCKIYFGSSSVDYSVFYGGYNYIKRYSNASKIRAIEFGKSVYIKQYAFYETNLLKVVFSNPPEQLEDVNSFDGIKIIMEIPILKTHVVGGFPLGSAQVVKISEGVETIFATESNYSLTSVYFPNSVKEIKDYAFRDTKSVLIFDFSSHDFIPTLGGTNALNTGYATSFGGGKIVVPDNLYDDWIVATNWVSFSGYIIKKSDYDAQK